MHIIGHRLTNCINFSKFKITSFFFFFTGVQVKNLMHYSLWSQIKVHCMLVLNGTNKEMVKHFIIIVFFLYLLKYLQIQSS